MERMCLLLVLTTYSTLNKTGGPDAGPNVLNPVAVGILNVGRALVLSEFILSRAVPSKAEGVEG
jgi:hypothetical protein